MGVIELESFDDLEPVYADVEAQIGDRLDYLPWAAETIGTIEADNAVNFATANGPGGKWAPLSPKTIKRKGHNKILIDKGKLRDSLVVSGQGVREMFSEPGQGGLSVGTDVEYARFHQTGTRHMPARPPVGMRVEEIDAAAESLADSVVKQLMAEG